MSAGRFGLCPSPSPLKHITVHLISPCRTCIISVPQIRIGIRLGFRVRHFRVVWRRVGLLADWHLE